MRLSSVALFAFALGLRLLYVFAGPVFQFLLYSDCLGYWNRANDLLAGHYNAPSQWACWPPAGHILMAGYLAVLRGLGVSPSHWLPLLLVAFCVLSALSCVWLRQLVEHFFDERSGLVAGVLYAVCWPMIYQCQYVLSENIAVPLLIGGIALVCDALRPFRRFGQEDVEFSSCWRVFVCSQVLGGVVLCLACAVRPQFLPVAVLVFVRQWCSTGLSVERTLTRCFPAAYAFMAALVVVFIVNGHISGGRVALAANGGINFAITQGRLEAITTGDSLQISAPQFNGGPYSTRRFYHLAAPVSDQAAYYRLGLRFLPAALPSDLANVRHLWFGPRFPSAPTPGFFALELPTQIVTGGGQVLCLLVVPLLALRLRLPPCVWLLWSVLLVPVLLAPAFGAERRFGYAVEFAALGLESVAIVSVFGWFEVGLIKWLKGVYNTDTFTGPCTGPVKGKTA